MAISGHTWPGGSTGSDTSARSSSHESVRSVVLGFGEVAVFSEALSTGLESFSLSSCVAPALVGSLKCVTGIILFIGFLERSGHSCSAWCWAHEQRPGWCVRFVLLLFPVLLVLDNLGSGVAVGSETFHPDRLHTGLRSVRPLLAHICCRNACVRVTPLLDFIAGFGKHALELDFLRLLAVDVVLEILNHAVGVVQA